MRVFVRHATGPLPGLREMIGTESAFPDGAVPTNVPLVQLRWHQANIKLEKVMPTYVVYVEVPECVALQCSPLPSQP